MVVVDEAHLLINTGSKRRQAVSSIDRRYMLLCTATPLCNRLTDIYSIMDLLYPGILGTEKSFRNKYFADKQGRVCRPEMKDELKKIVSRVMVRTLRKESGIPFTERYVYSIRINGSREEMLLYDSVIKYMKDVCSMNKESAGRYPGFAGLGKRNGENKGRYPGFAILGERNMESAGSPERYPYPGLTGFSDRNRVSMDRYSGPGFAGFSERRPGPHERVKINYMLMKEMIILQQSLSSSPRALIKSLENRKKKYPREAAMIEPLISLASEIDTYSKVQKLLETVNGLPGEQAVIFTLRLETAYMLCDSLNENFMPAKVYEGRLSGYKRQALIDEFRRGKIRYIVATDTAAEGLNLQNATIVINYDLHWNPMKIEQRIGRVHRRGQNKDVDVFNLVMKDTIDDYVLKVLFEKIDLFNMTIGGIEAIISEIRDGEFSIEETIMDVILRSSKRRDIERELELLREHGIH
ncbi:MAG: DEAD/DEAH box helicase [Clostridiaceae bacterium]|nr:DEAD/DEAH box helicase [Clostridiaceae bacterium]